MDASTGIDSLIRPTAEMVNITLNSAQLKGIRHVEYLSYPDENFESDELLCSNVHNSNQNRPLEDVYLRRNETFIPGQSVQITEMTAERSYNPVTEFLYPYLYKMKVHHGPFEWNIEKRYKHFHDLHKSLVEFVEQQTGRSISSLNKSQLSSNGKSSNDKAENESLIDQRKKSRPGFPTQNDRIAFINQHTIEQRCKSLQDYLNDLLKHPKFREHFATREFLEVSPISFVNGLGSSVKEGAIAKRSNDDFRGRSIFVRAPFVCDKCKFHHGQKWFVLKDSYLVYLNANSSVVGFPMLIDRGFQLNQGFRKTGTNNGIQVKNLQRMMIIKFEKEEERNQWFDFLSQAKIRSPFTPIHPLNSFAPIREKQFAQWFINGQSYMESVAKAILAAKEEIFITDWWLSPEILLIRPSDESMRLDNLLGKRAEEGIRVYVMVFKDIVQVVGLNSSHTKAKLICKSPTKKNIKVIRHPDHRVLPGTESSFLFSHHEKTLIIDQKIAFIGGIDLCWGRWDTDEHRLIDLGNENITKLKTAEELAAEEKAEQEQANKEETAKETTEKMAENADDLNPMKVVTADFNNPKENNPEQMDQFDGETTIKDRISNILHRHKSHENEERTTSGVTEFKKALNRTEREVLADEENAEQQPLKYQKKWRKVLRKIDQNHQDNSSDEEFQCEDNVPDEKPKTVIGITPVAEDKHRLFLGKDYSNSYRKDFEFIEKFEEDYLERQKEARMPWHDEALVVTGQSARDCARHFIQRWNVHKADKYRYNDFYPYLLPKSNEDPDLNNKTLLEEILGKDKKLFEVDSQCVRSVSFWSCGIRTVEHSIQNAYLHLIESAQHFIYIENQFFISVANDSTIKNGIGDALYRRISRAHINHEKFRVYVVLPLLPGFSNVNAVQAVLYFIMRSINKGETSLYQRLIKAGIDKPDDYITFYGMRNWDILMGTIVTEIIYVHSKLMIVDDRMCICGSANINDRSLLGSRDSEFCLVVHDREMIDSTLNGQIQQVGAFSSTWRKKLFRQILGIKNDEVNVDDPCSDEFYEYFRSTARKNALIYEEVFNTLPTNMVRKFVDVEDYTERPKLQRTDPFRALEKCKGIQGFIVEFPLEFLADDTLLPKWNTSEGMAPILLWT